jgi:hypothetical protein
MKMSNLVLRVFLVLIAIQLSGCLESSFTLSEESRIPYFLKVPEGTPRSDLNVTLDYYSTFSGGEAVFKLHYRKNFLALDKVTVTLNKNDHLLELKNPPAGSPKGYPSYEIIRANGVVDIIEHRKMEPIFYTTDDPAIWQKLGVKH